MTILDKSQNDKKDELIVNGNVMSSHEVMSSHNVILSEAERSREDLNPSVIPTNNVISTEVQRSGEISAEPNGVEGELTAPLSSRASSRDLSALSFLSIVEGPIRFVIRAIPIVILKRCSRNLILVPSCRP